MIFSDSNFIYNATIKLNELPKCKAQIAFPRMTDVAVNSRSFSTYVECVNSAKGLMDDVVADVNAQNKKQKFVVSAEVNPVHSGQTTRSRDWGPDELARLWIFDKKQEGKPNIHAVGQARIFMTEKTEPVTLLN